MPTDFAQMSIRVPRDEMERIDKAAKTCKLTKNDFVRAAALSEAAKLESQEYQREEKLRSTTRNIPVATAPVEAERPVGMSLDWIKKETEPERFPSSAPIPQQAPIVVNVGNTSSDGEKSKTTIDDLAAFVADGYDFERSQRKRMAMEVLRVKAKDDEERERLHRQLSDAVAVKIKKIDDERSIFRTARVAFDKLSDFFSRE